MVPDELLFITVHQVFELWLKLILFELCRARDAMLVGRIWSAKAGLDRCRGIVRMLVEPFHVLDTMPAPEFERFRGVLGTASGAQSAQLLEVEFVPGSRTPATTSSATGSPRPSSTCCCSVGWLSRACGKAS
jgi:tryptophan 2,3-dioxygenase